MVVRERELGSLRMLSFDVTDHLYGVRHVCLGERVRECVMHRRCSKVRKTGRWESLVGTWGISSPDGGQKVLGTSWLTM